MAEHLAELNKGIDDMGAYSQTSWKPTGRIWIDGKQIYERVFETTHSGTDSEVNTLNTDIDTLVAFFPSYNRGDAKFANGVASNASTYNIQSCVNAFVYISGGQNTFRVSYRGSIALPSNTKITTIVQATLK